MLHLIFQRVARPVVPAALRGGLRNQEIQVLRNARADLAENWSSLANLGLAPIAGAFGLQGPSSRPRFAAGDETRRYKC
jgi:hypothetical protein